MVRTTTLVAALTLLIMQWMHDRDEAQHARVAAADRARIEQRLERISVDLDTVKANTEAIGVACIGRR